MDLRVLDDMTFCSEDDGALVLDLSPLAPPLRMTSWEAGLAVSSWADGRWAPASRTDAWRLSLVVPEAVSSPVGRFMAAIPSRARLLASRCGAHGLAALRLLRLHPRARVVARNHSLLWLVARHADLCGLESAMALLDGTPTEVLAGCLGVEPAPGAVGLLHRIGPSAAQEISLLQRTLGSARVVRALRHVGKVGRRAMQAAGRHEVLCTQPFFWHRLRGWSEEGAADELVDLYQRTCALGERLGIAGAAGIVSRGTVETLFERWRARAFERDGPLDPEAHRFPAPRLPGTESIVWLGDSAALHREGRRMGHCVFAYEDWCRRGEAAAYRISAPERATVVVSNDEWPTIWELRGVRNAEVSDETLLAVRRWVGDAEPEGEEPEW